MAEPAWVADVAAGIEVLDELIEHPILEEQFDRAKGVLRDVPPEVLGVLDLLPQIGYGEIGQCCHTGHRAYPPFRGGVK